MLAWGEARDAGGETEIKAVSHPHQSRSIFRQWWFRGDCVGSRDTGEEEEEAVFCLQLWPVHAGPLMGEFWTGFRQTGVSSLEEQRHPPHLS